MEASTDWDALLDQLSACITPQEDDALMQAAVNTGSHSHVIDLHHHVAKLLLRHSLVSQGQLHARFPDRHSAVSEAPGSMHSVQRGLASNSGVEEEAVDPAATSKDLLHNRDWKGVARHSADASGCAFDASCSSSQRASAKPVNSKKRAAEALPETTDKRVKQAHGKVAGGKPEIRFTLADYPPIVSRWHPTKNGTKLPADYTYFSTKRVWLQCPGCPDCGEVHQWDATAVALTKRTSVWSTEQCGEASCPSCVPSNHRFCSCQAVSADERLAAEWHEDNPSPATVYLGSQKRFKWRCADAACGHIWESSPRKRSKGSRGDRDQNCPECYRREHDRAKHPSLDVGRFELVAEWDKLKNTRLPTEVSCGSSKKVWWLCQNCGNSWQATVRDRAVRGRGCPGCR